MNRKMFLLIFIISIFVLTCVGCTISGYKQQKVFSSIQSNDQIEDSVDIKDEINKEIDDIDNTINGLDDDDFKIKSSETKAKDKVVIEKRAESEKLKSEIKSKDNEVRNLTSKLQKNKVVIVKSKVDDIRKKLQGIKDTIEITKSSIDDVKIISNKLKLNILNKNYVDANKNLDDIIEVQQQRIDNMNKVNIGLPEMIKTLKVIN